MYADLFVDIFSTSVCDKSVRVCACTGFGVWAAMTVGRLLECADAVFCRFHAALAPQAPVAAG